MPRIAAATWPAGGSVSGDFEEDRDE